MANNRLEILQQFYADDPADPFNLYALALEYLKTDKNKSKELFDLLLLKHAEYLPTYYHAATLFIELNIMDQATTVLEKGIALARQQGQSKSMRELQMVYDELLD